MNSSTTKLFEDSSRWKLERIGWKTVGRGEVEAKEGGGRDATLSRRALNFPRLNRSDVSSLCPDRDAKNVPVLFRLVRAKTDFLEERCSPLFLSRARNRRTGMGVMLWFVLSPPPIDYGRIFRRLVFLERARLVFFIPLLTALFYLKSISFLTKPFKPLRPTFVQCY